jgi:pyruvate, orthophosphate dikinase
MSQSRVICLEGTQLPQRELIGGKAWSIGRMLSLGLRVPPAFVLPVSECRKYHEAGAVLADEVWAGVLDGIAYLESMTGRKFGDPQVPLLVSVRSGAAVSMPGMMDTVLNLGVTDGVELGLANRTGNADYALDTHARFCHQYGDVVLKADLETYSGGMSAEEIRAEVLADTDEEIPRDPYQQLSGAIRAVFNSWDSPRAKAYRRHWHIDDSGGTAVTIQAMVFGNLGDRSGTGVLFTRNPLSGDPKPYGEWLPGGQGDDVVGGTHAVQDMVTLESAMPEVHEELLGWANVLEREHGEVQDIEFTVEEGRLYLLQTRSAKRSPQAAIRIAVDLASEGVITTEEAVARVTPEQVRTVLLPKLDPVHSEKHLAASGEPACPGVACGIGVVDPDEAERRTAEGESIVLVRPNTSPNDVHGMIASVAVVTDLGGSTSHAAVVTRALGRPSVVGVGEGVAQSLAGKLITVDGEGGRVYLGQMPMVETRVSDDPWLTQFAKWAQDSTPIEVVELDAGEVLDLDMAGFGVGIEGSTIDLVGLTSTLAGANCVRGSLLSTPDGMRAALEAGVSRVVARPVLPVQVLAVRVARES